MRTDAELQNLLDTYLIDVLVDVVNGQRPSNKKALAIEILRYVQQQRAAKEPASVIAHDVHRLWNSDEPVYYNVKTPCHLETVSQNGIERLVVVDEKTPVPAPIPDAGYAVPLPVIPPSDAELAALALQAKRFSSENVAASVARLNENVRVMSPIEEVEASMAQRRELQERIAGNEAELKRLRALRASCEARDAQQ